jgi:hypothetical protein
MEGTKSYHIEGALMYKYINSDYVINCLKFIDDPEVYKMAFGPILDEIMKKPIAEQDEKTKEMVKRANEQIGGDVCYKMKTAKPSTPFVIPAPAPKKPDLKPEIKPEPETKPEP